MTRPRAKSPGRPFDDARPLSWLQHLAIITIVALTIILLPVSQFRGGSVLHSMIELVASFVALIVGIGAITRFFTRQETLLLFLGVGFLGAGIFDAQHLILTSSWWLEAGDVARPWSWNPSRTYLALVLLFCCWACSRQPRNKRPTYVPDSQVYLLLTVVVLISFATAMLMPLPRTYVADAWFGRPDELFAGTVFALATFGFFRLSERSPSVLVTWLAIATAISFVGQVLAMARCQQIFDGHFFVGHLTRVVSYLCVFIGLLVDFYRLSTDAIRSEQLVRDQTAQIRAVLDGVIDAVITIRADGTMESFNRAAERMFQISADDAIGKNVKVLMPSPYQDEHDEYLRNYLDTGVSKIIGIGREVVGLRADGTTFPLDLSVSEVRIGNERMFTGIVRDISGLKQAVNELTETRDSLQQRAEELEAARRVSIRTEQESRDQAARTQAILDGASDAIVTINPDGIIESFNLAAERIFDYRAESVIGQNVKMLMPASYQDEHDTYIHNYLTTGVSKIIGIGREVVGRRSDGSTFPMHLAISDVKLGDRRIFTGIVRDISDLKRAMQQLTAANDELARNAAKIEHINSDLQRSNEELKQFAYVASHDLQEPLRKVTAFCQLLRDDYAKQLDDNARTYIRYAVDGSLRMKALVQDLLVYSRVETQGKPLDQTSADEACREAIENLALAIDEAAADVTHDALPMVMADRAQLVRLFQNLIGNAIKYRGENLPVIHISAATQGEFVEFRVRDNGIGIDPQYHERIFVIFQRLHGHDEYSGTGIGLAVCKRIVERARGRIWVESVAGAGSEFCFTLPNVVTVSKTGVIDDDLCAPRLAASVN